MRLFYSLLFLCAALAALILWGLANDGAFEKTRANNTLLFPEFAARIDNAAALTISYGLGLGGARHLNLVRDDKARWRIEDADGYPANQELVQETLTELAALTSLTDETRLSDNVRLDTLGLLAPEALGSAVRFGVADERGDIMLKILLGGEELSDIAPNRAKKTTRFARPAQNFYLLDENKTPPEIWRARGRLARNYNIAAWINPYLPHHLLGSPPHKIIYKNKQAEVELNEKFYPAFTRLRPGSAAPAAQFDFSDAGENHAGRLSLIYLTHIIHYDIITTAAHIWVRPHFDGTLKDEFNEYNDWALRFSAETSNLWLPL